MTTFDPAMVWIAIVVLAVGTYALRASFLLAIGRLEALPPGVMRVLPFVPQAVLAALIAPYLVLVDGTLAIGLGNERLFAGLAAVVVAWRTENMLLTVVVGMAVLWALQLL